MESSISELELIITMLGIEHGLTVDLINGIEGTEEGITHLDVMDAVFEKKEGLEIKRKLFSSNTTLRATKILPPEFMQLYPLCAEL